MRAWGVGGLVAACLAVVIPSTAFAAGTTFNVNTTNDTLSAGACAAGTAGQCSLREAVIESNATPPTAGASNTIDVPAGTYQLTRSSVGGGPANGFNSQTNELDIEVNTKILGAGQGTDPAHDTIVEAGTSTTNGISLIFIVNGYTDLATAKPLDATLSGMTMRFGRNLYQTNDLWGAGGAVEYESADGGQLTLDGDLITENSATNGSGGAVAAFNDSTGTLVSPRSLTTITNSTISDNTDAAASGGTWGGIFAASPEPMVISNSTISGNQSLSGSACTDPCANGGGILEFFGPFVAGSTPSSITNSVISGNQAQFDGAGLDTLRPITISGTVFSNNVLTDAGVQSGGAIGGGAGLYSVSSPGTTEVTGSTFTGNAAGAGAGGGVANGDGTLDVTDSRIVDNSATRGGGLDQEADPSSVNITNATEDWWGCNAGPNGPGCDTATNANTTAGSSFTTSPWVVLRTTASPTTVRGGGLGTSTLTASFLQDSAGQGLTTSQIPELIGLPVAWSATNASVAPATGTIGAGGTSSSTLTTDTSCAGATGQATVDNVQPGDTPATASLTVTCPNLTATKTDDVGGSVSIGGSWNWTIKVANSGDAPATFTNGQTVVSDDLPNTNITYGTPTDTAGSGTTGTVNCSISAADTLTCTASGSVTIGTAGTLSVVVKATPSIGGAFTNPRSGGVCAADPANVIAEHSETDNACSDTVNVVAADLTAVKTNNVSGTDVLGSDWTWQIHVANSGAGTATFASGQTILTDDLPGGPAYGPPSVSGTTGTSGTGTIACSLTGTGSDTLTCTAAGGTVVLASGTGAFNVSLSATPPATGSFVNPRSGGSCAVDPDNVVIESNETNNQCADTVQVVAPDLTAATSDNVGSATTLGDPWVWTTTVSNTGSAPATFASGQAILSDDLPAGVTYDAPSATAQSGSTGTVSCAIASGTLTCTASGGSVTVPASGDIAVSVTAHPGATGTFANPPAGGACEADPDNHVRESSEANNACAADSVTVTAPDLTATNTDDTGQTTTLGGSWTWKVHIVNRGSAPATFASGATVLSDDLPSGPRYGTPSSSDAGMQCAVASGTMTCTVASLPLTIPAGGSLDATVSVTPAASGTFSNPATSGTCAVDPGAVITESDESNNACVPDTVAVSEADLTAANTDDVNGRTVLGDSWTWKIHVTNGGDGTASFASGDSILTDNLPTDSIAYGSPAVSGATGLGGSGSVACSLSLGDLSCTASGGSVTLPPGAAFEVVVTATPTAAGTFTSPRQGGSCAIDPGGVVTEVSESNNSCHDSVTVAGLPSATLTTPAVGATFTQAQHVLAAFSCQDDPAGPGLSTCVGSVANGAPLDTTTAGTHTFTVTATSRDGASVSVTHTYAVAAAPPINGNGGNSGNGSGNGNSGNGNSGAPNNGTCASDAQHEGISGTGGTGKNRFRISDLRISCSGVVRFGIRVRRQGQIAVLITASQHLEVPHTTRASTATASQQPAIGRFAFARAQVKVGTAGAAHITIKPNARGLDLVAHHRLPVRVRVWVVFTPKGGTASRHGFIGLLVIR